MTSMVTVLDADDHGNLHWTPSSIRESSMSSAPPRSDGYEVGTVVFDDYFPLQGMLEVNVLGTSETLDGRDPAGPVDNREFPFLLF